MLAEAPCDVALLVAREATPQGPVLVSFGGAPRLAAASSGRGSRTRSSAARSLVRQQCRRRQARREPPALARRARGPASPGHLGRAAADSAGGGGHAGGEPRRRPARRRAVDEVAPRGPRPGSPQTRQRGHPAHAARPPGSSPRRARASGRPDTLYLVDSPLRIGLSSRRPARRAVLEETPPTHRASACGWRGRMRGASRTRVAVQRQPLAIA